MPVDDPRIPPDDQSMRLCDFCQGPIPAESRSDARFCEENCRKSSFKQDIREGPKRIPFPPELREFRDLLLLHASPIAIGYQLALIEPGKEELWLPPPGRTKRFDGSFDDRQFFELRPQFEAPRVPWKGVYLVRFIGPGNFVEPIPFALSAGIYVPVETPMCLPGKKNIARRRPRNLF